MDYKNYILCGLIAFGMIVTVISKPASDVPAEDEALQNDQNEDYDYDGDSGVTAEQGKPTASIPKSTVLPYFDSKVVRRNVKPGGNITLACPVKNMGDSKVILWYKDENTIATGLNVLSKAYQVSEKDFGLTITNATDSLAGNYSCEVVPPKIRMSTILTVGNEPAPSVPTAPELPQGKEAATATESTESSATNNWLQPSSLVVCALVSSLLAHRSHMQSLLTF